MEVPRAYWTTVEECYTLMAVGHVHRNVSTTTTNEDPPLLTLRQPGRRIAPPTPREADCVSTHGSTTSSADSVTSTTSRWESPALCPQVSRTLKTAHKMINLLLQSIELLLLSTTTCTTVSDGLHLTARCLRSLTLQHAKRGTPTFTSATSTLTSPRQEC